MKFAEPGQESKVADMEQENAEQVEIGNQDDIQEENQNKMNIQNLNSNKEII